METQRKCQGAVPPCVARETHDLFMTAHTSLEGCIYMQRRIEQCVRAGLRTIDRAASAVVLNPTESVCEAREGQQRKVHDTAAEDAMNRPVAFSRSYWLRRRRDLEERLLRQYLKTRMPLIIPADICLRWLCLM